jgi:SET domain-containing protein
MMLVRCYLAPSTIEGLGVFCHDDIKAGQNVWRNEPILDVRLPAEQIARLEPHAREFVERYAYPDFANPDLMVLESDEGRFMNHSDDPNLDFSDGIQGLARWDIPAGTELTCHYATFTLGEIVMQPPRHKVLPAVQA